VKRMTKNKDDAVLDDFDLDQCEPVEEEEAQSIDLEGEEKMTPVHPNWTQYVLDQLEDHEKVGNAPTTDGLRRICERVFGEIISSETRILQCPTVENQRHASVTVELLINRYGVPPGMNPERAVMGAADVYWGNTEAPYCNHSVATAETRAEGRALRRAMRLTKVIVAEENSAVVEHDYSDKSEASPQADGFVSVAQVNSVGVVCKRLNVNVDKFVNKEYSYAHNIREVKYTDFFDLLAKLNGYQGEDGIGIPEDVEGYNEDWRSK